MRVPAKNVIGEVGGGFSLAQKWIGEGRIRGHGARPVGIARRALEMMIEYAKVRVTFGRPLAERQAIQFMIADSAMDRRKGVGSLFTQPSDDHGGWAWRLAVALLFLCIQSAEWLAAWQKTNRSPEEMESLSPMVPKRPVKTLRVLALFRSIRRCDKKFS